MIFSERFKELRLISGLTQTDVAEILDVSCGIISLWENGLREPTARNILKAAEFFGVTCDYLLGASDKP